MNSLLHNNDDVLTLFSYLLSRNPAQSGFTEWKRTSGRDNYLSALHILKHSIRRAWTINGPPARWSAARKSAEFRLYRSLPNRRRDYLTEKNIKNLRRPSESIAYKTSSTKIVARTPAKTSEIKKSSIPVFRSRNSREFEDLRSPHESPKRSLIPQRYRNSTDDLRRSREDVSCSPSHIPKLLSPRIKEDKLKRQDSRDELRYSVTAKPPLPHLKIPTRFACSTDDATVRGSPRVTENSREECQDKNVSTVQRDPVKMAVEPSEGSHQSGKNDECKIRDETDDAVLRKISDTHDICPPNDSEALGKQGERDRAVEEAIGATLTGETPVVRRRTSKEEHSNDDADEISTRRCSSHLSPEASPLSTRSSKYSPRESESEPTPALPRKTTSERGESSSASQRIRDAITRTRRESTSSAKYESSGSDGVRLGDSSSLSNYADIARRVKLFGSGSIGASTGGSCDEILQRDSATSAGEDDLDEHSRVGLASQNRVLLRRRRQFDTQGPRRRGRSHIGGSSSSSTSVPRSCCPGPDDQIYHLQHQKQQQQQQQQIGSAEDESLSSGPLQLDYRRLVFISSDSSSGREEDDADSSCSGSSYLAQQGQQQGQGLQHANLDDCDWDYFESNSLKLPSAAAAAATTSLASSKDWSCCPARPSASSNASTCCQACGGSRSAKVLPVPVPIPVPVPYPVPVPASLWSAGELQAAAAAVAANNPSGSVASSIIAGGGGVSGTARHLHQQQLQHHHHHQLDASQARLSAAAAASTWFSWNPGFDSSSLLQLSQSAHIFPGQIDAPQIDFRRLQSAKEDDKTESDTIKIDSDMVSPETSEPSELMPISSSSGISTSSGGSNSAPETNDNVGIHHNQPVNLAPAEPPQPQPRMLRPVQEDNLNQNHQHNQHQEHDSHSSSGRSSADSSELEDSSSAHGNRFLRVLHVTNDSLSSDEAAADPEDEADDDSDSGQPVLLRRVRALEEDAQVFQQQQHPPEPISDDDDDSEISDGRGSEEEELAGVQGDQNVRDGESNEPVLLRAVRAIDPEELFVRRGRRVDGRDEEEDDDSTDSALMPDSLEVSAVDLDDSIEVEAPSSETSESAAATPALEGGSTFNFVEGAEALPQSPHCSTPLHLDEHHQSLVMITQANESYQPVNVITSDTTTLMHQCDVTPADYHEARRNAAQTTPAAKRYPQCKRISPDTDSDTPSQGPAKRYPLCRRVPPEPESFDPSTTTTTTTATPKKYPQCKRVAPEPEVDSGLSVGSASESDDVQSVKNLAKQQQQRSPLHLENLPPTATIITASPEFDEPMIMRKPKPLILEDGLADDDSWVEEISERDDEDEDEQEEDEDDEEGEESAMSGATSATEESSEDEAAASGGGDREEELRGYHRQAIDFTLHTIVEESCEESESEHLAASWRRRLGAVGSASKGTLSNMPGQSDLNRYLFFGPGSDCDAATTTGCDSLSETSSILSDGLDSLGTRNCDELLLQPGSERDRENGLDMLQLTQDEYQQQQHRRDSDGSVGSDSEGRPSPEAQRRKKLVRARGTGRSSHSSSLDNLLALASSQQQQQQDNAESQQQQHESQQSEGSSTETDVADEANSGLSSSITSDQQFDTVKRKKKKQPQSSKSMSEDSNKTPEPIKDDRDERDDDEGAVRVCSEDDGGSRTPQPLDNGAVENASLTSGGQDETSSASSTSKQQQSSVSSSRDSGFVGSCDDLLQHPSPQRSNATASSNASNDEKPSSGLSSLHGGVSQQLREVSEQSRNIHERILESQRLRERLTKMDQPPPQASLARKDSFNNWSSDEETNLMMSKMRQFFKTMVATSGPNSSASPAPSPSPRLCKGGPGSQRRAKPPQLVYFENELTRLMKTVPGIRDEQVREIVEYLSSEDTWSDSYDSSDYTSSDLEGCAAAAAAAAAVGGSGRRSALQEQISQSCHQIISRFDQGGVVPTSNSAAGSPSSARNSPLMQQQGKDTALVYQKLVQSFTKMTGENAVTNSDVTNSPNQPHSSPPLIAKVMHHIGSRLVALMHEVSESNTNHHGQPHTHSSAGWRRYPHHRTPSSASTTEDDDSTSDSASASTHHHHLPRSKSHDPLLLLSSSSSHNSHLNGANFTTSSPNAPPSSSASGAAASAELLTEERGEASSSDYERFSWRGSFESALMSAADSRTKLSLLACSGEVCGPSAAHSTCSIATKRRSAGDLLFNPRSFSREQLDRVRSCGSIGASNAVIGGSGNGGGHGNGGHDIAASSLEDKIWSNRRRSSVPDANTNGTSSGDEDSDDDHHNHHHSSGDYLLHHDSRATTLPRGLQGSGSSSSSSLLQSSSPHGANVAATSNSLPRQSGSYKAHFLPQQGAVKSARYRAPGYSRNSPLGINSSSSGPKRALSAPGLQLQPARSRTRSSGASPGGQSLAHGNANASSSGNVSASASDEASSLSEACSTPIIGASSRSGVGAGHTSIDLDDMDRSLHAAHLATRASLSSLGARSDSMASVYSGAGEGRWCGSVAVKGEVEFSLQYDYKQQTFDVHVTQCRDLAPVDVKRNRSDPYVKVYLLPDKSKSGKRKTKVKKHTLNPAFDETLKFHTSLNSLESRTLWLTVWHSDMFGRNDFLGEVRMPLENKIFDDPRPQWYPLQERTEPFDDPVSYKGEVIVGLKFVPPDPSRQDRERDSNDYRSNKVKKNWSKGSLHVLVKEARNLQTRVKNSGTCDPFCKSYLLPDKGRSGKQKTGVVRRSSGSPVWNHTFVYKDVSLQELAERGLELTVWDHDRIASNEFLGGVRFNLGFGKHYGKAVDWMDATGREMSLWQNMLERPNFWVEGAVTLRPNLHNHGKTGTS
ncbi:hypothetical protein QAD02_005995 [Eretmocerus hayati]|uniref:Uncharacterized protein n=1 Tax=Eretmocerus hayati TaxID=131215 RepID=A0ACC2N070_9HYME|nr:hypothetical protein QAD02_005995 [Eretmocerus hayati]